MATLNIHPKYPNSTPIYGAQITAELIDLEGNPIWGVAPGESFAGRIEAVESPRGSYTLTLEPNTGTLADTRYQIRLMTDSRILLQLVKIPGDARYNLEDVTVRSTVSPSQSGGNTVSSGGVAFTEADKTKLDSVAAGAEVNVQANWNQQDATSDSYIKNKPLINEQGEIVSVTTTTDFTGHGSASNPLGLKIPFTSAYEAKLQGIEAGAQVNVQSDWNEGSTSSPAFIKNKPIIITRVRTDHTILGDGVNDEMGVTNPYTDADEAKVDGIEEGAQVNVKSNWNEHDPTSDAFIQNKPVINSGGQVTTLHFDGTMRGNGSQTMPAGVANPFTSAYETKLNGISAGAEVNVQSDWDITDNTQDSYVKNKPDIQALIAAEDKNSAVDVIASQAFTLVSDPNPGSVGSGNPGVGIVNLGLNFTVGSSTFTITYVFHETAGQKQFLITITPGNHRNDIKRYHIQIGTTRLALGDAKYVEDAAGDSYFWDGTPDIGNVGDTVILSVFEPLDKDNFVPDNGTDGDVLFRRNSSPTWEELNDSDINGFPTTADKVAAIVGQVLRLKSDKTGYELATITSGGHAPTKAEVYTQAKDIVVGGRGIDVAKDDSADTLTVKIGASRAGNTFPLAPMLGDQFDLLKEITLATHAVITSGAGNHNTGYYQSAAPIGSIDKPSGLVTGILWYDNNNVNYAPYRRHLVIFTGTVPQALRDVTIGGTTYTLRPVSGGTTHIYVSTNAVATNPIPAGSTYQVQVTLANGVKVWPDITYPPHTYVWDGNYWHTWFALTANDILGRLRTLPKPWLDVSAISGNINNRFSHLIMDEYGQGLNVTRTTHQVINAVTLFNPVFDLDDVQHGVFTIEATLAIGTRSTGTLGFTSDTTDTYRIDGTLFASALKSLATYTTADVTGTALQVENGVDIYNGTTKLGSVHLHLAKNSSNQLGYFLNYVVASPGGTQQNFTATVFLGVSWSPSDAPTQTRQSWQGEWAVGVAYAVGDMVAENTGGVDGVAICIVPHTSSATNGPYLATDWRTRWRTITEPDIHELTARLPAAEIAGDDHIAISDESTTADEPRYVTVADLLSHAPRMFKGVWTAGVYAIADEVLHSNIFYKCLTPRVASDTQPPNVDSAWRALTG